MYKGSWFSYSLPTGYLHTYVLFYSGDGAIEAYTDCSNLSESPTVYATVRAFGTDGVTYYARGGGDVYNWHSGGRDVGTYGWSWATYHSPNNATSTIVATAMSGNDVPLTNCRAYSTTASGETFGTLSIADIVGAKPDWISARATNGKLGYIDVDDFWVPTPLNPADAVTNFSVQRVRIIPVYDEPGGTTVVGYFEMHYGGGSD